MDFALARVSRTSDENEVIGLSSISLTSLRTNVLNGFRWIFENSILPPRFFSREDITLWATKDCVTGIWIRIHAANSNAARITKIFKSIFSAFFTIYKYNKNY